MQIMDKLSAPLAIKAIVYKLELSFHADEGVLQTSKLQ